MTKLDATGKSSRGPRAGRARALAGAAILGLVALGLTTGCGEESPPTTEPGAAPAPQETLESEGAGSPTAATSRPGAETGPSVAAQVAPEQPRGRVIVIGIDGASPRIVFPLIEEGRLPNLASLARDGGSGEIRSLTPISSPLIWNTVATGKSPEKHGITAFSHQDQEGTHHLYLSTDRRVRALWNIASEAGITVSLVNMWNTYPPEDVAGVVVSDHLLAKQIDGRRALSNSQPVPTGDVIRPASWQDRLAAAARDTSEVAPGFEDPFVDNQAMPRWLTKPSPRGQLPLQQLSRRYQEDEVLTRLALEIERELRPGLTMILLPGIDRVSHFLWGFTEPSELYPPGLRAPPAAKAEAARTLRYYYAFTDALIGRLIEGFGPEDLVLVLSDHGFEAGTGLMLLTGVHEGEKAIDGVLFARGPGITPGSRLEGVHVADVTPTVLAWLGFPTARDMDGRVAPFLALPGSAPGEIPSYDETALERATAAPSGVEADIVEQLRGLGYLE